MLIGAHVSVAGGYRVALEYARDVGCECVQIFAKSPRRWDGPPPDVEASRFFAEERTGYGIRAAFTHTAYLINLAANDPAARSRSISALADEIVRARLLGAEGVITHLGTDPLGDREEAAGRIASAITEAFDLAGEPPDGCTTRLLLENSAGSGTTYGRDVDDLAAVFDAIGDLSAHVGVCIDTCHAHAAGLDVRTPEAWRALVSDIDARCGTDVLRAIHANDCVHPFGSRKDRHAWIGDGTLGEQAFSAMLAAPLRSDVCALTEMPGDVPIKDVENIRRLVELRSAL